VSSTPCSRAASLVSSASGNSSGMNGGCSAGGSGSRYGIFSAAVPSFQLEIRVDGCEEEFGNHNADLRRPGARAREYMSESESALA